MTLSSGMEGAGKVCRCSSSWGLGNVNRDELKHNIEKRCVSRNGLTPYAEKPLLSTNSSSSPHHPLD